jgi:integrase
MPAPIRRRVEPGIFERVNGAGDRLGLEIQYKDADGRPRRRGVQGDIHDARDALAAARTRRARHEFEPADVRTTLAGVIERYRETVVPTLRPKSQVVYRSGLTRAEAHLGPKRISSIDRADIRGWVAQMITDELKANTVRKYHAVLRAVFTFARRDLNIPVSFPALDTKDLPDPYDDQREHRVLTDKEVAAILGKLTPREALYFRMLAETGVRASEGLAVAPEGITGTMLKIRRQLGASGKLVPLKSRQSRRDIEITRSLAAEIKLAGGFPNVTYWTMLHAWADAVEDSGIEHPLPVIHDLRHTHASKLIAAGWDPVEVAKRLGDRIETILRTYAHEFDARKRSAERQAALEAMYAEDGYQMATSTSSQAITRAPEKPVNIGLRDVSAQA